MLLWKNSDAGPAGAGLLIFDLHTGKQIRIIAPFYLPLQYARFYLAFSSHGALIASGKTLVKTGATEVEVRDVATGQLQTAFVEKHAINQLELAPQGDLLAVTLDDTNNVQLRDAYKGQVVRELKSHRKPVTALAFSPDGKTLASGSDDGTVKLWRLK